MKAPSVALIAATLVACVTGAAFAQSPAPDKTEVSPTIPLLPDPPPLKTALVLDSIPLSYTSTPAGRIFLALTHADGSQGPQVVEMVNGKPVPFPDAGWNSWSSGGDAAKSFVHVHAARIGPKGDLWIVDSGAPGFTQNTIPGGAKVVRVDLSSGAIKVRSLGDVTTPLSRVDDIRFHGPLAYFTDAGSPGVILLNMDTGVARRALDGDTSMTAQRPITADDHVLRGLDGKPVKIHTDQMEVSPDGKFFFYQPASGPMSRIATRYLDDPKLSNRELAKHITTFSKTASSGGSAIDANGTIYLSDIDARRILTITPDGHQRVLIEDPRLDWVSAMWLDSQGWLVLPAAQLDHLAPFNGGVTDIKMPIDIFKVDLGVKPPAADHP